MSSLAARFRRRALKKRDDYEPKAQPTIVGETYYLTLHPTKGWRCYSYRRVEAERRAGNIFAVADVRRQRRAAK